MSRTMLRALPRIALAAALLQLAPAFAKGGAPVRRGPSTSPRTGPATAPPVKGATVEGITEYDFPNGLRLLLFPDASSSTVTVNMTVLVGSRHEGYGETGMAHLLEHMLFKGTPTSGNLMSALQAHGARFNGSTWTDRTNYFETLSAEAGNLEWALGMEADRLVNSKVAAEDLTKEFSVVRNEFEMNENDPESILEERMMSSAYLWHNYGKSTIGSKSDIERVPIESLRAFYRRFYQPDNVVLVVAGKIDPEKTLALVGKDFGALPRPERKLDPTYTVEPVQDGERQVALRRTGDVAVAGVLYHGLSGANEDFVAEEALVHLLTDRPNGRLYKALVEKGLAAEVKGEVYTFADPSVLECFAKVKKGQAPEAVQAKMIEVVEGLAKSPITDDELERFRRAALKGIELAMTRSDHIGVELSEWAAIGDWRLMFIHRDRVKALTRERVQRFAASYLKQSNRTSGLFLPTAAPDRSPLPDAPDVRKLVAGYQGQAAMAEGEAFAATVENVEGRTVRSTLASGTKVALLAKKTRGASVRLELSIHYGSEADLKGRVAAADLLTRVMRRGTKKHGYQQLNDELDRLRAEVGFVADGMGINPPGKATLRGTTVAESLPAVLGLVAEMVREPSLPQAEFDIVKQEELAALEKERSDPQAQALRTLWRKVAPWPKEDVRYVPTTQEDIDRVRAVTREDLAAVHRDLWGGSVAEISIVGDFDPAKVKEALAKGFGDWRAPRAFQRVAMPYRAGVPGSEELIKAADKENAFIAAAHAIELGDDDPDYPAMTLINYVLGGGAKSRLVERLRQKEGLSYFAFSRVGASPFEKSGLFFAGAICAPKNATRALELLVEEVKKMVAEGVPQVELDEAKKSWQMSFNTNLGRDEYVAGTLARWLHLGRTLAWSQALNTKIQALTVADVGRVAKKYLDPARLVKIRAGDLAN